jgi:hypothetical protein
VLNKRNREFESIPLRHIWTQPRCKYLSEDLSEESGCSHIFGFFDGRQSEAPEP